MADRIHVEEYGLNELKNALATAGEGYKEEFARLTALIDEITRGDIQGDPADDLLEKFKAKETDFKTIAEAIDKAEEYAGVKGKDFVSMINELKERSH